MGGLFFFNSFRQEHDFEVFSHARGRNQVFELKRDLGALLGHVAIFKCVGELGALADAHQKLCLSDEGQMVKAGVFASTPQGGEVYLGCDVLLAWGLVRSALDCVLPEYGDRASLPVSVSSDCRSGNMEAFPVETCSASFSCRRWRRVAERSIRW